MHMNDASDAFLFGSLKNAISSSLAIRQQVVA